MKKQFTKSPLKANDDKSTSAKKTESKQILKTSSGRNYGVNTETSTKGVSKTESAGSKISSAPTVEKAKRYKKQASAWKGSKAGLAAHNAKKRAEWDKQDAAAEASKPAPEAKPEVSAESGNDSEYNKIPTVKQAGNVTTDYRGAVRSGKFLTRAAAQAEARSVRQADKANKFSAKGNEAKAKKLTVKSEMNATNAKTARAMQSRLAEQNEQGKTGHSSFTTDAPITEGQSNFAQRGMTEGGKEESGSSTVTTKTTETAKVPEAKSFKPASFGDVKASAKAADADMQKRYAKKDAVEVDYEGLKKSSSPVKMMRSSVLKMFKPGSFKMSGFGTKSKK